MKVRVEVGIKRKLREPDVFKWVREEEERKRMRTFRLEERVRTIVNALL